MAASTAPRGYPSRLAAGRRAPQDDGGACCAKAAAAFRKHSRHRQSPPSVGIGSRAVSSAHQQGPERAQVNSVPQPEQARRREAGVSNRFVMNRTAFRQGFNSRFIANSVIIRDKAYAGNSLRETHGPQFASRPCRAQSLRPRRARRRVGRFRQCGFRSPRFRQGRTGPPQRRAAGGAGTAVHTGTGPDRVRLSVRDRAGAQRGRQSRSASGGHRRKSRGDGGHRRQRSDGSRRDDAAAKTRAAATQYHPENLPRRGAGAVAARGDRRLRTSRAPRGVLVQPFLHLRQQGRAGPDVGGLVRARGDPPLCAGPLRRHAQGGGAASGDAVLSRQPAIVGARNRARARGASAA